MITEKTSNLFNFIEFLHSNIDNFNQHNDLISELNHLRSEKRKLKPKENYKDNLKHKEIQTKLKSKLGILQNNTANPIKNKAIELNICDFSDATSLYWQGIECDIAQLKDEFNTEDLTEIFKRKKQYLEYRNSTHRTFLSLDFFFTDLDEITLSLFDYFNEKDNNEIEILETKTKKANSIEDILTQFNQGYTVEIPTNNINDLINNSTTDKVKIPQQETKEDPATHLKELFIDETYYPKIIDILIEENFIEKGTLIWKDEKKGKGQFIAGLIKALYYKNYLKRMPTNTEIPLISKNTFKVQFGKSTSEKAKVEKDDPVYKMIPIVTELQ